MSDSENKYRIRVRNKYYVIQVPKIRERLEEIKALIDLGQDKDSADMEDNPSTD